MKIDQELLKLQGVINAVRELESRMYRLDDESKERLKEYVRNRFGYFFKWLYKPPQA